MTDIMQSIYDMMGKYTYPNMKDTAPREHVDNFFQVRQHIIPTLPDLSHEASLI